MRDYILGFITMAFVFAIFYFYTKSQLSYQNDIRVDTVSIIDTIRVARDTVTVQFDTVKIYKKYYDTVYVDRVKVVTADTSACMSIDTLNDSVYIRAEICGKLTGKIDSLRGLITYKLPDQITIKEKIVLHDTIKKPNYRWVGYGVAGGIILGIIAGVKLK
jgi:hypothetical protein